uniref:Ankyrin repeat protein n=1 Tax=Strongyloides papillosus TaxID=174720 RepID=A0A0N5C508_STREA
MSSESVETKDLINDCDSLSDITKLLSKTNSNDYEIHKKFDYLSSHFDIKISNIEDIRNSDILCSDIRNHEKVSINNMKTILSNQPKINFEISNYISFLI